MAEKEQTTVGGSRELPAGATEEFRHRAGGEFWVSLVQLEDDAADHDTVYANVFVDTVDQGLIPIQTAADDGPDETKGGPYPIRISGTATRLFCLIRLDAGDELVFKFENQDGANPHIVHFDAAVAGTMSVALENRTT